MLSFYCRRGRERHGRIGGSGLFPYPLPILFNRYKMTVYIADMAETQMIIRKEKTDCF